MDTEQTPPWLFTERGVQAAIKKMTQLIEDKNTWVASLDIKEFYPSVQRTKVLPKLPINKKVAKHVAFATTAIPQDKRGIPLMGDCLFQARRGAPQGAITSAAITMWIMKQLKPSLPDDVHLIVYADNLFLLSTSRQKVEDMAKSLGAAVAALPGGTFSLKPALVSEAKAGINALGHCLFTIDENVIANPNSVNIHRYEQRVKQSLARCRKLHAAWQKTQAAKDRGHLLSELAGLMRYIEAWHNFFPDPYYMPHPEFQDPAVSAHSLMNKWGITKDDLSGWENGKVKIASNPSKLVGGPVEALNYWDSDA